MGIYAKELNNKCPVKSFINKYLFNGKEESSTKFALIMKEYIKKLFPPKNIRQGI